MPRDRDDDRYDDEGDRPRRRPRRDDDFDRPKSSSGKTLLIVFGILGAVFLVCGLPLAIGLLLPAVQKVREAAARQVVMNNFKQIGLSGLNDNDVHNKSHGPFLDVDETARPFDPLTNPTDRLSWRIGLLPYLEQENLYRRFKLKEPWNSPANLPHADFQVKPYLDPADPAVPPHTRVRLFYDNGALFDSDRSKRVSLAGIPDGAANTIMYVESGDRVGWTQSNDFKFDPTGSLPSLGHPQRSVIVVAMADGSVKPVKKSIDPEVLKRCIRANDGQGKGTDLD